MVLSLVSMATTMRREATSRTAESILTGCPRYSPRKFRASSPGTSLPSRSSTLTRMTRRSPSCPLAESTGGTSSAATHVKQTTDARRLVTIPSHRHGCTSGMVILCVLRLASPRPASAPRGNALESTCCTLSHPSRARRAAYSIGTLRRIARLVSKLNALAPARGGTARPRSAGSAGMSRRPGERPRRPERHRRVDASVSPRSPILRASFLARGSQWVRAGCTAG
jgi:hypothetical protein